MLRRTLTVCLLALAAPAALIGASGASAKGLTAPVITKVSPMRISVGGTLTIRGRHFKSRAKRNTVIFRASNGRSALVKPRRASRTKLVLKVRASVARLLTVRGGAQRPTRLKLRVLAGKFSKFTPRRLSPVVLGANAGGNAGGGGGASPVCDSDADHDNDLLSNTLEQQLGTDPCLADTDADAMIDGWEYYSAKDLNIKAVPYPGTRPYPNALDPSDGRQGSTGNSKWDFDGDGLSSYEEYRAWRKISSPFDGAKVSGTDLQSPLGYSDGTKFSRSAEAPPVPAWKGPQSGMSAPAQPFPATYDLHGDPAWRDDERDADRDGLSNYLESARGPSDNAWWQSFWGDVEPPVDPWPDTYFGYFDQRPFTSLDLADADVDGDTLLDGEDDQDFDDYSNISELYEIVFDLDGNGALLSIDVGGVPRTINAMNPCAPSEDSRTCDDYKPF
jgi:hypothetical protein